MSVTTLPLMENFYTIQGEGFYQGRAAYFMRLGGCDVGCVWCDVKESWPVDAHPKIEVNEMVGRAVGSGAQLVVVTGGEPALYELTPLTDEIHKAGLRAHIETSGAYPLTGDWDWVCLSPKKFKVPDESVYPKANELKVIIFNKSDFTWAEQEAGKVSENCRLYIQPEWSREKEILPSMIDYVKKNPKWAISLQVHKYMNIP
jgi:7-carboxy-7-deazaguanine synthase